MSSTETETELEAAVTRMFRRYGTVFVKIRRDPKNMPYAFCQFTVGYLFTYFESESVLILQPRMIAMLYTPWKTVEAA